MTYLKPLPKIDPHNEPFWDGLREHKFLVPKCDDCGDYNWVPYPACRSCLSENQTWTEVSGRGVVFSYSIAYGGSGAWGMEVPYGIIMGKLEEGPRSLVVLASSTGIPLDELRIGMPIKIVYEDVPDENITLYRWSAA